jgi:MFS family permease
MPLLALICVLTFLHYGAAQMRAPLIPIYAAAHGASAAWIGLIVGAHMAVAAVASIPLGRMGDKHGRRLVMLAGIGISAITSLLLPLFEDALALTVLYGVAGLGVAAFTPCALALVGDSAPPGKAGHAFAWYTAVHYAAIAIGPFIGGLVADGLGYGPAFIVSGIAIALTLALALAMPMKIPARVDAGEKPSFRQILDNRAVWAGWVASSSGLFVQGVIFTYLPLMGSERGLSASAIGLVFLVLGVANTLVRFPAGWLVDRAPYHSAYASAGILGACAAAVFLPYVHGVALLLALAAVFGALSGFAFVAIGVALATAAAPSLRGAVMGGYSTSLYLGLALGSFVLGPVVDHYGHHVAFAVGGAVAAVGALGAALLWSKS